MKYKYLVTNNTNPYINLALEQCLEDFVCPGEAILFLWQNDDTIVIGRNQNVYDECLVDEFLLDGGRIARRFSGGGAVYHDCGNLNYSFICKSSDRINISLVNPVKSALESFNMSVEYNGRNDLLVEGRKFSGNAFFDNGSIFIGHGTIMINSDIERMEKYLTPNKSKLARNGVKSISSRVINLSSINSDISVEKVKGSLIESLNGKKFEFNPDILKYEKYLSMFSDSNWIMGGNNEDIVDVGIHPGANM